MSASVVSKLRRRDLVWAVVFVVFVTGVWIARSDFADAGGPPPGKGIAMVFVTVGTNYPDSLGVGPGAALHGAPIILVPTNPPIPSFTEGTLISLDPRRLMIIGGTSAVSAEMETAIRALLPNAAVDRISGSDRYHTNGLFALAAFPVRPWISVPSVAFTGDNPAGDSVTVNAYFGYNNTDTVLYAPIHLPDGSRILALRAYGWDTDGASDFTVELWAQSGGTAHLIAEAESSGTPGQTTVVTGIISTSFEIVNNEEYAYLLVVTGVDSDPTIQTAMVRIEEGTREW